MKRIFLLVVMGCIISLIVGCGSQSAASSNAAASSAASSAAASASVSEPDFSALPSDPSEIKLSDEEIEFHGVHLRVPNSCMLDHVTETEISSIGYSDKPITREIPFSISTGGSFDMLTSVEAVDEVYDPAYALNYYGIGYDGRNSHKTNERTQIDGTYAVISRFDNGSEQWIDVDLFMKSDIIIIRYGVAEDEYPELIQESIDSIRIDEEEIPDIVKAIMPGGLEAAGLRQEVWEIDCEQMGSSTLGVYINMPEDFAPIIMDDGELVWVSSDDNTLLSASVVSADVYEATTEESVTAAFTGTGGFEGLDYFAKGIYHSMYCMQYVLEVPDMGRWVNILYAQPFKYGSAGVMFTVIGSNRDDVQLDAAFETLRYADGYFNNGILDVDAIAEYL